MPEQLASTYNNYTQPTEVERAVTDDRVRWARVALVSLLLLFCFFLFEHDPSEFAGVKIGDTSEDRIADTYIDDIEAGSSVRKLLVIGYAFIGLTLAALSPERRWHLRWEALLPLLGLMMWAALSAAWSDDSSLTVRRLAATTILLVGSLGYARAMRPNEILFVAMTTLALFVGGSLLLDLRGGGRPWESNYRFGGTLHPNIQAAYCAVLCLAAYCLPSRLGGHWLGRGLFGFGFVMLVLTQSRTSVIALLVGLLAAFMVRLSPAIRWWSGAVLVSLAAMVALTAGALSDSGRRQLTEVALLGRTDQAKSLTGRVPLWQELSRYAADKPITGYGYDTFWSPDRIAAVMKTQDWAIQSAHNAYFDLTLQLGLVGLGFGLAFAIASMNLVQAAYSRAPAAGYAFAYGLLAFAFVNSLLESHFVKVKYPSVLAMIVILGVVAFFPEPEEATPEPENASLTPLPRHA
ncbi:O-Antigen ligase [Planctomycetes bacterium MalM25]|nr:O-Antigen ligase [Planctomycetes bacterium MalM25]